MKPAALACSACGEVKNGVQTCLVTSPETPGLEQAVIHHGRDLAALHRLGDQSLREAEQSYVKEWKRRPKASVRSGTARARLLELVDDVLFDEIEVTGEGQDYVRVFLPFLGAKLYLRSRPKVATTYPRDGELLSLDLFGMAGTLYMFWQAADDGSGLAHLSIAEVLTPPDLWWKKCVMRNEIFVTADVIPIVPAGPTGIGNYDDDLNDVLGRWENEDAQSEEETTDEEAQEEDDGTGTDSAMGDDGN
jgi:hypothetical protein